MKGMAVRQIKEGKTKKGLSQMKGLDDRLDMVKKSFW